MERREKERVRKKSSRDTERKMEYLKNKDRKREVDELPEFQI